MISESRPNPSSLGVFSTRPAGTVIHGSRSGSQNNQLQEYKGTVNYAAGGADGLYWQVTVGPGRYCVHGPVQRWGWHAGDVADYPGMGSQRWLGAEFAQAQLGGAVDDSTFLAFAFWFRDVARVRYPTLPTRFRMHSEMPQGVAAGKTDLVLPEQAGRVRARIQAALRLVGIEDEVTS